MTLSNSAIRISSFLNRPISIADVNFDGALHKIDEFTAALVKRDPSRTPEEIAEAVSTGLIGECCISHALHCAGYSVIHNDEKITQEYHWDLKVVDLQGSDELKLEIKFQHSQNQWLSFPNEDSARFAAEKWRSWNLMIAWKFDANRTHVIPWLLISNEAFDPEKNLYVDSQYSGKFLKTGKGIAQNLILQL